MLRDMSKALRFIILGEDFDHYVKMKVKPILDAYNVSPCFNFFGFDNTLDEMTQLTSNNCFSKYGLEIA